MKKIFTVTIVSLMLILTIVNSCSKSAAPTPTPTPTPTPVVADSNTVVVDGTKLETTTIGCTLSGGSSNVFTMSSISNDQNTTVQAQTHGVPTAGTYNVKFKTIDITSPATDIQLSLLIGQSPAQIVYTAQSGTATIAVGPGMKLSFTDIVFEKQGSTSKKASSTLICN